MSCKFSAQYISEHIQGYSAFKDNGNRIWQKDKRRLAKIEQILKIIEPRSKDRILEVGCGLGAFLFRCAQAGSECYGIDIDREAIDSLGLFFSSIKLSGKVELCHCAGENLKFEADEFDKVLLIDVLEHVDDSSKKLIIKEAVRVLRPGGELIMSTPNKIYLLFSNFIKNFMEILRIGKIKFKRIPHTPGSEIGSSEHIGLTNPFFIRKLLSSCGLVRMLNFYNPETRLDRIIFAVYAKTPLIRDLFVGTVTIKAVKEK